MQSDIMVEMMESGPLLFSETLIDHPTSALIWGGGLEYQEVRVTGGLS